MGYLTLDEYLKKKKEEEIANRDFNPENIITLEEYRRRNPQTENKNTFHSKESIKKEESSGFFKSSSLYNDDKGNWFTDTVGTIGSSIGDAAVGLTKGIMKIGEGIGDLTTYGIAQVNDWTGNEEKADKLRENAQRSAIDELFQPVDEHLDKGSVFGNKSDNVIEGLGYVIGMTAISIVSGGAGASLGMSETAAATLGSTITTFSSAMGNGMSEAYSDGANDDEAWLYGFISGVGEAGSELMFGGLGKASNAVGLSKGVGELDDKIIGSLTKPIKNKMVKTLSQYGLKAVGEGFEEVASGFISALGKKATYMKEEDFKKIIKDENLAEQFWMGTLTSAIAQAPSGIKSTVKGTDYISGRTANEEKVYNTLLESKSNELKTQKTLDNMINDQQTKLKELYGRELTAEEINTIKETVNEVERSGRLDTHDTKLDYKEQARIKEEIENDLAEGNLSLETIRDILGENVDLSKDNLLQRSIYEDSQKYEDYKVELTGNEKVDKFLQSAQEAGVNNTTKTRKRIELISKLVENTDRNYRFVNQEQLKENGYNENANGLNDNGEILLNVNSNKEIVAVVGHETTHLFDSKVNGEYTQEYKDLQDAVKNFLQANGTYETKINEINDTYSKAGINLTQDQIMEEITADTIGDNLFGENSEEFIKHLTTNRNVFQKIYDYIKKAVKNIKGYDSEEARQLQNLKDAFDRVYKTLNITEGNADTKYSIGGIRAVENIKSNPQQYNSAINSYNKALKMIEDKKTNKEIFDATGWFRGDNGKLKFNFSDADIKLINQQYDTKKTYKLEDILEHKTLFEFYPELKEYKVIIRNLSNSQMAGGYKENTKTILLNKKIMNDQKYTEGTLIHEIQHAIQGIEGFTRGSKSNNEFLYRNNKGELEAEDTARRMIKEKYDNVDMSKALPRSANFRYSVIAKMRSSWYDFINKIAGSDVNAKSIRSFEETTSTKGRSETIEEGIRDQRITLPGLEETSKINNETKYSLTDNQGRTLSKEQQEYFKNSKAKNEKGQLEVVYHGSNKAGFTVFNRDFNYYTNNKQVAQSYTGGTEMVDTRKLESVNDAKSWLKSITEELYIENNNIYDYDGERLLSYNSEEDLLKNLKRDIQKEIGNTEAGGIYQGYINIEKPITIDAKNERWSMIDIDNITIDGIDNVEQFLKDYGSSVWKEKGKLRTSTNDIVIAIQEAVEDGKIDADGVIIKNVYDEGGYGNTVPTEAGTDYITFNSNQFKAADNKTPTSNSDIRYSISNKDNQGRILTEEQQEYFKDSKVRDENGNLLKMYHSTNEDFNTFTYDSLGKTGKAYGEGFYFTDSEEAKNAYGNKTKTVYLDIKKPMEIGKRTMSKSDYKKLVEVINKETNGTIIADYGSIEDVLMDYEYGGDDIDLVNGLKNVSGLSNEKFYSLLRDTLGYDGIKANNKTNGKDGNFWLAFNSNQIKNIDNLNPTENPDIRYSMTQGETDQYWKKLDKNDLQEYNTIESEVGNNGEQQIRSENDRLQERTMEEVDEEVRPYFERIKELTRNVKKGIAEERQKLNDFVIENVSDLPVSKTKVEKFVRELANNKIMTQDDVRSFLKNNNKYVEKDVHEYLQNIRKDISAYTFKLNEGIKADLRYKYDKIPRNIKLNNNSGLSVDQVYQELNTKYPDIFSDKIVNEADQAAEIIDFMRDVNPITINETNVLTDEEIDNLSNQIYGYKQYFDEVKNYYGQYFLDEKKKIQDLSPKNIQEKNTPKKLTRKMVREQILQEMNITDSDLQAGNDISSLNFQLSDPIRVNEKVFGREIGKKINDLTINQTKHNTAEKIRWQNKERDEIYDLGIKARSKESAAVQKYGEKQYVDKNGDVRQYGDKELAKEFPNIETQNKIKNAAQVIRGKYDTYIEQINEVLTALGYDAIPKRQDYMRHFQELGDIFSKTGVPFNLNDMSAEDLPTDINGLTEFNKPGKNWFAQAQKRYGEKTTYDAITGIDGYLEGAGNIIFHTQDIQNYRAVTSLIRDTFGSTKGFEKLDGLSDTEAQQRIKDIQDSKLSKYVAWLDEQANSLAGKKGAIDRGVERFLGRKAYTFFNTIKKQVGSNMTGLNVRSSLTNLISSTIAAGKTNKIALAKGTLSTINNMLHNDGFIDKSDFLTARFGSDTLSNKLWQKISNAGQVFMNGTDYFTANIITRSKYYEGLQKGMTETDAIKYADDFASRVMGDRSQGATAEAFNSKTLGLFTQFQLEVNNQWQYMVHDTKMDYQQNSEINGGLKAGATALFQLGQIAAYSYFFNEAFEKITGSRAAFDPIEIFKKLFGLDDDDDEDKSFDQRLSEAGEMLVDNIPFGNLITGGGRIPISEAFTGVDTLAKKLTNQQDKYGNEITWENVGKDMIEALPYWVLPTGYSQASKTAKGLSMYNDELPVAGSYTDSGNLRYTVEDSVGSKIQAGLFGAWANPYAQDYIDSGYKTIDKENIDEMVGLDMNSTEYRKFKEGLSNAGNTSDKNGYKQYTDNNDNVYWYDSDEDIVYDSKYNKTTLDASDLIKVSKKEEKLNYINSLDLTSKQKNLLANNLNKNSKKTIDMKEYGNYDSYEEYQYARDYPGKYAVISQICSYNDFKEYNKKINEIEKEYKELSEGATSKEKTRISKQKKSDIQSYINSLDLNQYQKMMLEKEAGGYSIKNYSSYIQEYLDSTNLSNSEKYEIWEELFN